jgi:hypothetical protein
MIFYFNKLKKIIFYKIMLIIINKLMKNNRKRKYNKIKIIKKMNNLKNVNLLNLINN